MRPVRIAKIDAVTMTVQTPIINGMVPGKVAEWVLVNTIGGWCIQGLRVRDTVGTSPLLVLNSMTNVWEFAFTIGQTGAPSTAFAFFGFGHGNVLPIAAQMICDGYDVTALPVGTIWRGTSLNVTQAISVRFPDAATTAGYVRCNHNFSANGVRFEHHHEYSSGYELWSSYGGMCPLDQNVDTVQVGSAVPRVLIGTGGVLDSSPAMATRIWHSTAHPYSVIFTMPNGPEDIVGYLHAPGPGEQMWLQDRVATPATMPKIYCNYVGGLFANRILSPLPPSNHTALYQVKQS